MASARESRRRRIMERGTDRLAFITGQSDSLPPPPPPPPPPLPSLPPSTILATNHKNDVSDALPLNRETINQAASNLLDTKSKEQPSFSSSAPALSDNVASSSVQTSSNPATPTDRRLMPQPSTRGSIFNANSIVSSISASENIRLICSAAIALLVVLSFCIHPKGDSIIKSIIFYRPIYLVLLTDVTVVVGLLMTKSGLNKSDVEVRNGTPTTVDWTNNLGKALGVGLMVQKALGALIMDCSVCAVLLICGLSLLRLG